MVYVSHALHNDRPFIQVLRYKVAGRANQLDTPLMGSPIGLRTRKSRQHGVELAGRTFALSQHLCQALHSPMTAIIEL